MAFSSLMIKMAEAPSVICEELAAVTWPFSGSKAGLSLARDSREESGRMPSSAVTSSPVSMTWLVSRSKRFSATGMISFSKRPSAVAVAARWWLCTEKASMSSRVIPHFWAMSSAEVPCMTTPPRGA